MNFNSNSFISIDTKSEQKSPRMSTRYREHATILADFNFSTTTAVDDCFQFVDCSDVDFDDLAKDIRAGVVEIMNKKVIIVIGNLAAMDNFTNVIHPVNLMINSLIDRFGCVNVEIWVVNVLPCPAASEDQMQVICKQNRGLAKAVNALIRRKRYSLHHVNSHKWFLKRVKCDEGKMEIQVDGMFYHSGTVHLNQHGLEHYYLLLVRELKLWQVQYEWSEMPVVKKRVTKKRKVLEDVETVN